MPFALHTCGVTTVSTLHTNSYRTRLVHHYPTPHDPHVPSRRAKAAQQPRTTWRGKPGHHLKSAPPRLCPLQASEVLAVSARQPSPQTSHSQLAQRLLPTLPPQVSRIARPCSCSGPASFRPRPGQEPLPGRAEMPTLRNDCLFQPTAGSRLSPAYGFREACRKETAASTSRRICPAPSSPARRCRTLLPAGPRRRFPALPPVVDRANPKSRPLRAAFYLSPLLPCGDLRSAQDVIR